MKLLLELGADCHCNNLPTTDEVPMIIPDEYQHGRFHDIVLAYWSSENINNNQ